ncbi:unnamed protein product [Orchesella dallaii]|uniref:B30.2/SPRY domain-containing protein n=1 Tax=Orchesella dallaii TaxID=48710 RepID=A0ABP1Q4A0_9HEXA
MATTSILSRTVITQIFGTEFVTSLEAEDATFGDRSSGESKSSSISNGHIHSSPAVGHVVGVSQSNSDGMKPSKSPRTSPPVDEMDTGEPKKVVQPSADVFGQLIQRQLDAVVEESKRQQRVVNQEGRLGPNIVKYDASSHIGTFIISNDRLSVNSQCNFGSVKACSCVYKGKWQYEVQLGSKGVMQIGWATLETKFSQEKGVGDTIDSYAYDGNRLRKWNKTTSPYGETWQAGDIIGCCIDLDEGKIDFYRNGKPLGTAFSNIRRGPGVAYFPAASLAYGENIVSNFGATPLQYLVEGFSPLQLQSSLDNAKTDLLLSWLNSVLSLYPGTKFCPEYVGGANNVDYQTLLVITNRLIEFLGPHLQSGFVVEQSFFPFFASCLGLPEKIMHTDIISAQNISYDKTDLLLDIMWTFLEETEMKTCLEKTCVILMNHFRSNSLSLAYPYQHYSLYCLLALARHRATRRHMIRYLLFDKTKLMHFLHVRPMDETVLKEIIPETWWPGKSPENSSSAVSYENTCRSIQQKISDLQSLQVNLMKQLLNNADGTERRPSSRALFLRKFRQYVRDVVRPGSVLHQPINKAMATFFCFLRTVGDLYREEVENNDEQKLPDFPCSMFFDTSISYYEMERVGGIASYLYKTHHKEVCQALSIPDYMPNNATTTPAQGGGRVSQGVQRGTPMPSALQLNTSDEQETTASDGSTSGENSPSPTHQTVSNRTITIAVPVPRIQPVGPVTLAPLAENMGILSTSTPTGNAITQSNGAPQRVELGITPLLPSRQAPDHNNGVHVSATSSGEDVSTPMPVPHLGAALIAGTPSGHSMLIPMLADFRNFIAQGERGFTYFPGGFVGFGGMEHRNAIQLHNPAVALLGKESGMMDVRASLRELLDNAIIIYSCGVQRHVEKVVGLRNTMEEYVKALDRANTSLNSASISEEERTELVKSVEIFTNKLDEQARHIAWVKSAVFTKERQIFVYQLLKTVLATLKSSTSEGVLFAFVPEHYISTLINLTWFLLTQMHPTVPHSSLVGLEGILTEVAEFVAKHFADTRIIIAETKDTLTQALSSFICNRTMLTALEQMPSDSQISMVKSILRPYENRAWAQSNWMLVRFWQGSGFGFQYPNALEARRPFRAKPVQDEFGISTNLPPTPSRILQNHVANVLLENQKFAVSYIHSVLNQLNWAFSEFVGLLQEIQNAALRPERVFIEARQLKICCTCFELTQALLRVVEMVSTIASPVITDASRESSEPLLARLCMLLSQIMNRIGNNTGCFAQVIELDIPGLENVTYYPLLSSVGGILVSLIVRDLEKAAEAEMPATRALLCEPSFQVESLNFFFGRNQPQNLKRIFSLQTHVPDDVSESEIGTLEKVVSHLADWTQRHETEMEALDDDSACTICYASPQNTTFKPCNHRACK